MLISHFLSSTFHKSQKLLFREEVLVDNGEFGIT